VEIRYLLQLLREYRRLIALSAGIGCLLALALAYVVPEKYEAETKVLIRPRKAAAEDQAMKSLMDYPVSFNIPVDTMAKTYAEVMGSEAVAARVVDALHLDTLKPPPEPRWWKRWYREARDLAKLALVRTWEFLRYGRIEQKDPHQEAVEKVMKGLKAKPITDTFLFSLKASNADPEMAARVANAAAQAFIDYTRQARMDEEGTGARDIRQRLAVVRGELDGARGRLQEFGEGTTAASIERQLQLRLDELSKFESSRAAITQQLSGLQAETATLRQQLAAQSSSVHVSTTAARNPAAVEIEDALTKAQVEYAGRSKTLLPDHPRMLELKGQIEEAQQRLAAATQKVPERDTSALNQTREQINQRLLDRMAQASAASAQLHAIDDTIARYRRDVDSLTAQKVELTRLTLDLDVRETEYRLLSKEEAQLSLAAIQQLGEIRQLSTAVPPVYPARPIKIYYAVAGLSLGFILALFAVLLMDYADPRVHDFDGLTVAVPEIPVVAVVPHLRPTGLLSVQPSPAPMRGAGRGAPS
jgi:uncharacterized protein involved in exopolysaccharide biosynthesis